jgi:hypothetical protein
MIKNPDNIDMVNATAIAVNVVASVMIFLLLFLKQL